MGASSFGGTPGGTAGLADITDGQIPRFSSSLSKFVGIAPTSGQILFASLGAWQGLPVGTSGQFLKSNASSDPAWTDVAVNFIGAASASSGTSITVSSIPTGYKTLNVALFLERDATGAGADVKLVLNSDTGANYNMSYIQNSSGTVSGASLAANAYFLLGPSSSSTSGAYTAVIHNEASLIKHIVTNGGAYKSGASFNMTCGGQWNNTANEITAVTASIGAGAFAAGTRLIVWGVRG